MSSSFDLSEVAEGKTGAELFRELSRIYSVANVEDYYKMGQWKDTLMRTDYVLIEHHRLMGRAPEPPPLEEVPMPELPKAASPLPLAMSALVGKLGLGGLKGTSPSTAAMLAAAHAAAAATEGSAKASFETLLRASPTLKKLSEGKKIPNSAPAPTLAGRQVGSAVPPSSMTRAMEMRNMAVFIAKNKLDPSKAKPLLTPLSSTTLKAVIAGFQGDSIDALEDYIADMKADEEAEKAKGENGNGSSDLDPLEELKRMANFVAKKKLDPKRAKAALLELSDEERNTVMDTFETSAINWEATEDFETYVSVYREATSSEPSSKRLRGA